MAEQDQPKESPMIDDWTDQKAVERYKFHAREIYDSNRYMERASMQAYLDYAKWLLVSLLSVHGGAIYAISTVRDKMSDADGTHLLMSAAAFNVAGIVFTLLTGAVAWLNFQAMEHVYAAHADPAIIYRNDLFNKPGSKRLTWFVLATYWWVSITCAALALITFIASAKYVFDAIAQNAACNLPSWMCGLTKLHF